MIITNNEEALKVVCEDVLLDEVDGLRQLLENELARSALLGRPGIGLAAPQIGIAKKMAVVRLGKKGLSVDLVNAKIEKSFSPKVFNEEGCLSFPGRIETTTRFQEVHIVDNLVYPNRFIATGLLSVVCQHELDHLNQTLFFQRAIPKPKAKIKLGPNDPCVCSSGKKYKKCCQRKL